MSLEIEKILNSRTTPLTFNQIYKVVNAQEITDAQKENFLKIHNTEIQRAISEKINATAFKQVMQTRKIQLFKPIKNSYTKAGDKKILAEVIDISPTEIDDYIKKISVVIENGDYDKLPKDKIEYIKTYVYRHGKKREVINFLDYELSTAKDILKTLYSSLSYNTGGMADYFIRPIHKMDNDTLIGIYNVVDKNLTRAEIAGNLTKASHDENAKLALIRIYEIQNNQHFQNAVRLAKQLKG